MNKIERKTWDEFRQIGLLRFVNMFLHVFGWSIVIEIKNENSIIAYPARVRWRGFSGEDSEMYKELTKFLADNSEKLLEEANE